MRRCLRRKAVLGGWGLEVCEEGWVCFGAVLERCRRGRDLLVVWLFRGSAFMSVEEVILPMSVLVVVVLAALMGCVVEGFEAVVDGDGDGCEEGVPNQTSHSTKIAFHAAGTNISDSRNGVNVGRYISVGSIASSKTLPRPVWVRS